MNKGGMEAEGLPRALPPMALWSLGLGRVTEFLRPGPGRAGCPLV